MIFSIPPALGRAFFGLSEFEEHFYLVWPPGRVLCTRRGLLLTSALLIVAAPIVRFADIAE